MFKKLLMKYVEILSNAIHVKFFQMKSLPRPEMEPVRIISTLPVNFKNYAGWPAGRPVSDWPGRPFFYRRFLFTVQYV